MKMLQKRLKEYHKNDFQDLFLLLKRRLLLFIIPQYQIRLSSISPPSQLLEYLYLIINFYILLINTSNISLQQVPTLTSQKSLPLQTMPPLQFFIQRITVYYQHTNQQQLFQMIKFLFILFLFVLTRCAEYFRLDTKQTKKLLIGDTLVSTLGYFKATLKKQKCSLSISIFDSNSSSYTGKGNFNPNNFSKDCEYLEIVDGKVQTNTGDLYMEVKAQSYNESTILNIDDEGTIRIIGTYISSNRVDIVSKQTLFENFKTEQQFVRSFSKINIDFGDRFPVVANNRGWKFIAEFGQLTIYYGENPALQTNYVYSSITIRDSRIYDFSNKTFPGILYNNISFAPRCFEPKKYLGFKPPYTFEVDPFWPKISLYEQGRYKIFEAAFSKLPQHDFEQDIREVNYYHFYSPCPRQTFDFRGNCVAKCPAPYYHQIRGESGFCVLTCEQYGNVDEKARVCSCVTAYEIPKLDAKNINKCPKDAEQSYYGCVCKKGFYDSLRTFGCVTSCPEKSFGINGLCMKCPQKCLACTRDNYNRLFLQCTTCEEGYNILNGQCVKKCVTNHGYSLINGICEKCSDTNCVDCSNDKNVCLKCNLLTVLANGTCKNSCQSPAKQVYSEYFSTSCKAPSQTDLPCFDFLTSHYESTSFLKCDVCFTGKMHLDGCIETCPVGYYAHNDKYCACSGVKNLTINDQCLASTACPITMSFDIRSHSCISCPFGCMSCINTQCTSCNPGYFLYISPQSILCRRKSPLFTCDNQYSWHRDNVCFVTEYQEPRLEMTLCRQNIPQCQICIPRNKQICVLCNEGFMIYNNTCIATCPANMIQYENTCILQEIDNCEIPHLRSITRSTVVTINKIEASQSYKHYIYDGMEPANDPVGYIPYFQKLTVMKSDGIPRQTFFFEPQWVCMKCQAGMGMSPDLKQCRPCPHPCTTCYYASNDSCLAKIGDNQTNNTNNTDNNTTDPKVCQFYKDQSTGQCISSCSDPTKYPAIKDGILICDGSPSSTKNYIKIDSAVYPQNDGSQIVIFAFSEKLEKITMDDDKTTKDNDFVVELKNKTRVGSDGNMSESEDTSQRLKLQEKEYLVLDGPSAQAYIMDLSDKLKTLRGEISQSSLPNRVYGINGVKASELPLRSSILSQTPANSPFDYTVHSNYRVFIQTWLAYIGYIFSIVIILLHAVFIGMQHLYKVDNLLIFIQSIFYFIYTKNFVGKLLSQYYYGFSWAHARFLPNIFSNIVPDHYQQSTPLSYKMINLDGNFFRNAGFSLGWLLIFIGAWILVTLVVYMIFQKRKAKQIWYPEVAKQSLLGGVEFFSMNLMFFSYAQLHYSGGHPTSFDSFYSASQTLAIITIIFFSLYSCIRYYTNPIAGLYMFKRILIPAIIFSAYQQSILLIPLLALQIVFAIWRFKLEAPQKKMEILSIIGESIVLMIGYFLLFLCLDAGVNAIFITIIIFLFVVYLAFDLTTIYLEYKQEYLYEELEREYQKSKIGQAKIIQQRNTSNKGSIFKRQSTLFPSPSVF